MLKRMDIRLLNVRMLFLERFLATAQKVGLTFSEADGSVLAACLILCWLFAPYARICRSCSITAPAVVTKYQKRISGPLINRIDTACRIEVPRVDYEKLSGNKLSESSETIRARVQAARNIHQARFTNPDSLISNKSSSTEIICNADMRIGEIRQFCQFPAEGGALTVRLALRLTVSKCQSLMRTAISCCTHGAVRESIAVIPVCLSLHHEIGAHHCRFSGK